MEKIVDVFVSWQVLLLSFAAFAVLSVVRKIGTRKEGSKVVGGWAQSRAFKLLLPAYPYVLTLGVVFVPGVPLPEVASETVAVKLLFGIYAGWLSSFSFQLVKNVLEKGFNMKFGADRG